MTTNCYFHMEYSDFIHHLMSHLLVKAFSFAIAHSIQCILIRKCHYLASSLFRYSTLDPYTHNLCLSL